MWLPWPATSVYQDMQAEAFLHGQTHLMVDPDPRLLALPNPYDPDARAAVPYVWDASLFNGHFYLYWGPVPALLITPVKAIADVIVGDNALVFLFLVGSLFWCTKLLTRVWQDHLRAVPGWIVLGGVLTAGWANPMPWLLNAPWIYESAIAGGQFFLLMGVYALYPFLGPRGGRATDLLWAGVSFSLAVGTRSSLAPAVVFVTGIVIYRLAANRTLHGRSRTVRRLTAYLLPLAIAAAALGLYNEVRFGSPFEFGQRYQLTSVDLHGAQVIPASVYNLPPNLYNYLVNPVRILPVFPYLKPHWGGVGMSVLRLPVPPTYFSWQIAGLLVVAPFSLYSLAAAWGIVRRGRAKSLGSAQHEEVGALAKPLRWITGVLLGIAAIEFAVVQVYVVATMRYLADFMPSLLLAASIGLWQGISEKVQTGRPVLARALIGLILMTWTAVAGLLLGITSYYARFEKLNPDLFDRLTRFFTP